MHHGSNFEVNDKVTEVIDNPAQLREVARMTPDGKIRRLHATGDYLGMALLLHEQQKKQAWAGKHQNFMAYVASLKINSYRTVMNLIRMTKDMKNLGYTPAQTRHFIETLGTSKTWIMYRRIPQHLPVHKFVELARLSNPELESSLKFMTGDASKEQIAFTATISAKNYNRLMAELKKYGMVEAKKKYLKVGPAFDAFLTDVLKRWKRA